MNHGFSLVEVIVALVVLGVGLLGTTGLLISTERTMSRAELQAFALGEIRATRDSLQSTSGRRGGTRVTRAGRVVWTVSDSGFVDVRFVAPDDVTIASIVEVRGGTFP